MVTKFNVFEILEIAGKIEHDGAKFYREAAESSDNPEIRNTYFKLANWRTKHEKIVARMRKRFSKKTGEFGTFDPDNYVLSHPQVMAGLAMFTTKPSLVSGLTVRERQEEILKDAIRRGREAIVFYRGLKDFTKDKAGIDTIDQIIKEENRHIRILTQSLE